MPHGICDFMIEKSVSHKTFLLSSLSPVWFPHSWPIINRQENVHFQNGILPLGKLSSYLLIPISQESFCSPTNNWKRLRSPDELKFRCHLKNHKFVNNSVPSENTRYHLKKSESDKFARTAFLYSESEDKILEESRSIRKLLRISFRTFKECPWEY